MAQEMRGNLKTQSIPEPELCSQEKVSREPFDQNNVTKVLHDYLASEELDPILKTALTAHTPLICDHVITLEVDNEFLLEKLNDLHLQLSTYLKKNLKNDAIHLVFSLCKVEKKNIEKQLFTSKDKFHYLLSLNPGEEELQKIFGLEIE